MKYLGLDSVQGFLQEFCKRNHIVKLSLFGSAITNRFGPESDVDLLVEFEADKTPSLFKMVELEIELSTVIGRKVDLRTAGDLGKFILPKVLNEAQVQYASS